MGHGAREGVSHWGSLKGNWKYKKRNIRKLSKLTIFSQIIVLKFEQQRIYVRLDRFLFKQFQLSLFGGTTCNFRIYKNLIAALSWLYCIWKYLINAPYWNIIWKKLSITYSPGLSEKNDFLIMHVHVIQLCMHQMRIKPPRVDILIFYLFIFAFVNFVYLDIVYILSIKSMWNV